MIIHCFALFGNCFCHHRNPFYSPAIPESIKSSLPDDLSPNKKKNSPRLVTATELIGLVGHIEDIAVAKDQQGKKLGLRIIQALDYVAEKVGCYKVIFNLL